MNRTANATTQPVQRRRRNRARQPNPPAIAANPKPPRQRRSRNTAATTNTNAPAAVGRRGATTAPRTRQIRNGVVVCHSEYITDILNNGTDIGTGPFNLQRFDINPGLYNSFPWLSQSAPQYESYRFRKLNYRYQGTTSSSASGSVYLAVEYDASDPNPGSKTQIANWQETKFSSPWDHMTHVSTRQNLSKRNTYYVRNGTVPANSDVKLYDTGYLCVVQTNVMPAANTSATIGEIWVDYEVELQTPQLGNAGLNNALFSKTVIASNTATTAVTTGNLPVVVTNAASVFTFTIPRPLSALVTVDLTQPEEAFAGTPGLTTVAALETATSCITVNTFITTGGGSFQVDLSGGAASNISVRIAQYDTTLN